MARSIVGGGRRYPAPYTTEIRELNGEPAMIVRVGGRPALVLFIEEEQGKIQRLRVIANPDKLQRL